jgi:outer membrane biosynthesis protein TonB
MENDFEFINPPLLYEGQEEENVPSNDLEEKNLAILAGLVVFCVFVGVIFIFLAGTADTKPSASSADNQLSAFGSPNSGKVAGAKTKSDNEATPSSTPTISPDPSPTPTNTVTPIPTESPTPSPEPTSEPTSTPSPEPTVTPTVEPTTQPDGNENLEG